MEIDMFKNFSTFVKLAILLLFFQACYSNPLKRVTLADANAPKWVLKEGDIYHDSSEKIFYGVGSASGINNFSLQRIASDDRARNNLAKGFEFYTKSLTKNYMASTTTGDFKNNLEEQAIDVVIKIITSATLKGVKIVDHWEHPYRNELYSLAKLDIQTFKQNLNQSKQLNKILRKDIGERADKLYDELEKEILKKEEPR